MDLNAGGLFAVIDEECHSLLCRWLRFPWAQVDNERIHPSIVDSEPSDAVVGKQVQKQ